MRSNHGQICLSASDLSNHLACKHLTELDRMVTTGKMTAPTWRDPSLAILQQRGQEHEDAYIESLKSDGLTILNLLNQPKEATLDAMSKGADIIVQASVGDPTWIGRVDILRRVPKPSELGAWSYEVEDTKLAQDTRTSTILQLCLYTDFVASLQGCVPTVMHVVKPGDGFSRESFLVTDFQAYFRLARQNFVATISQASASTYPDPISHCDICRWWKECDSKRHKDDHLSLIAGIHSLHIGELQRQGIQTLQQFAEQSKPLKEKPQRGNEEAFAKAYAQARIQLRGRKENKLIHELLAPQAGRGLARLPEPSAGDVYFDFEADPFFDEGGIEYLLGYTYRDKKGHLQYSACWGLDRATEKTAFESFIDFVMTRWENHSDMHIYHFSPYEPGAIKRLTGRHGTREIEVDEILRSERFVDLFAVTREGLMASVEHYSLKDLERFTPFKRKIELPLASASRRQIECALELGAASEILEDDRRSVEEYNRDDCMATAALHDWLEERRSELEATGVSIERPENKSGEASEKVEDRQGEIQKLFNQLVDGLPEDRSEWSEEHKAKWLLAHIVGYFSREFKCACWEYFRLQDLDFDDLIDDRKAVAGLEFLEDRGIDGRSAVHRYRYPSQEVGIRVGDDLQEVKGAKMGKLNAIDHRKQTLDIKKTGGAIAIHPKAVHSDDRVRPGVLETSLLSVARAIAEDGLTGKQYSAAIDLLMKNPPRLSGKDNVGLKPGEDVQQASMRIAQNLEDSCLAIQGPPGTGKTYTGGYMIARLAAAGKRIGVTAVSHKVILNLLDSAIHASEKLGTHLKVAHKGKEGAETTHPTIEILSDNKKPFQVLDAGYVVGGTAWLWARDDAAQTLDYLFVDEAGQMSLAQVLAAARSAKNLILLGDPQQLEQPQKGAHPEGADIAALSHLLDGHKTIPIDKGLFLDTTWRLHPTICEFTSELYYEGRLKSREGLEQQKLLGDMPFAGSGLFYVPVSHQGNQIKSVEEVTVIAGIVHHLLKLKVTWTNASGKKQQIIKDDILIVAPYNGQIAALQEKLLDMRIGTVDKFQGQEAPVVIYSMTSSSPEDAPRGMSFLYSPNRFNVATSRARCAVILVGSPSLFEPDCKSVEQMRWTNALCRYREMAKEII